MDEGWVPYRTGNEPERRLGLWQRLLNRLAEPSVDYNYEFEDEDRAEAAVAALRAEGIPARVTLTGTGPVALVKGRFRRRAEPIISRFEGDV